jgi:hypothetical protein
MPAAGVRSDDSQSVPKRDTPVFNKKGSRLKTESVEDAWVQPRSTAQSSARFIDSLPKPCPRTGAATASILTCSQATQISSSKPPNTFTILGPEKESDRIPFSLPGDRNVIINDHCLHDVAQIGGGIRVEYYSSVVRKMCGKAERYDWSLISTVRLQWMTFRRLRTSSFRDHEASFNR